MVRKSSMSNTYEEFSKRKIFTLSLLAVTLLALTLFAVSIGPIFIHPKMIFTIITHKLLYSTSTNPVLAGIIFDIRIPRVLMAVFAGLCLSTSGVLMQGLLRNPLASPYVLGVAAGASFGAALVTIMGVYFLPTTYIKYALQLAAFTFALLAMIIVYGIVRIRDATTETLILAGIAIGTMYNGGVSLLMYFSGENLRVLVYWIMGGLWTSSWEYVLTVLIVTLVGLPIAFYLSWNLNALAMGEETASTLGVNVRHNKFILLLLSTILTATVVSLTGIIGFVGLVAPHIARIIIGPDHRFLIPCSCFIGAILVLSADTVARTVINPTEIPVGVLTSMIGAPFFIYLIIKKRKTIWL